MHRPSNDPSPLPPSSRTIEPPSWIYTAASAETVKRHSVRANETHDARRATGIVEPIEERRADRHVDTTTESDMAPALIESNRCALDELITVAHPGRIVRVEDHAILRPS